MDAYGFARPTYPDLFARQPMGTEFRIAQHVTEAPPKVIQPVQDNRYPAYAAPMQDGRLVTDYRNHCSRNVPTGAQFSTKQWMVNHTEDIIRLSRLRQAEWTGASLGTANTVPPPADIAHSTPFTNDIMPTNAPAGIGLERADAKAPELFGSYTINPSDRESRINKKKIATTTVYQGGRNSIRGMY